MSLLPLIPSQEPWLALQALLWVSADGLRCASAVQMTLRCKCPNVGTVGQGRLAETREVVMVIVLHPEQAREIGEMSAEFDMPADLVVRQLLSGPLLQRREISDEYLEAVTS